MARPFLFVILMINFIGMTVKEFVSLRKGEMKEEISSLETKPRLMIIQVNEDPASDAYVRGKLKDGAEVGADVFLLKLPSSSSQDDLLDKIKEANEDPSIDGLIVQLPLPKQIDEEVIKLAVSPEKDVDGFHPLSPFVPCTPKGIIIYLEKIGFPFKGSNAVVIGRSNIVGKPMAKLLLERSCNVTVTHSKTKREDLEFYLSHADLIVVAVGKEGILDNSYKLKEDAVVVDVGINRGEDGHLHGDATPNLLVKLQTPVPGGVGLLTRLALLENLMEAYKR